MLKRSKKSSKNQAINTIFLFILFLLFPVSLLLSAVFCILIYPWKIRNTRLVFSVGSFALVITFVLLLMLKDNFLISQLNVFKLSLFNIINLSFLSNFALKYDVNNFIFALLISIEIALYFKDYIACRAKKESAGLHHLDKEIETIVSDKVQQYKVKDGVCIGSSKGQQVHVNKSHCFITGTTGTGKTVLISNYIEYCAKNHLPTLIVDGKGDVSKTSIKAIAEKACKKYGQKLYLVDMNDTETSVKYNPFVGNPTIIKDMIVNLTDWSEEHYKVNFERYLLRVLKLLTIKFKHFSFKQIVEYTYMDNLRELSIELSKEGLISKEDHTDNLNIIKTSGKIAEDAVSRFANLQEATLGSLFEEKGINVYQALEERSMVVFVLNPLLYPVVSSSFGRLVLMDAKNAVSKLYTDKQCQSYFIFDEINVYASSSFLDLVNKCRSADVSCVLAMQSLSDIEQISESFKNQIIENCNNFVFMRQNTYKSAEECSKIIGTHEKMKMTYKVDGENESTGAGSARRVREFIVHPDTIKNLRLGEAIFLNKDYGFCTEIKANYPKIAQGEGD